MDKPIAKQSKYSEKMLSKAKEYYQECVKDSTKMPFLEELGLILGVNTETISNWSKDERIEKFGALKKSIMELQKLRLMQAGITGGKGMIMNIFLLKANHGLVETDKHINQGEQVVIQVTKTGYIPDVVDAPKQDTQVDTYSHFRTDKESTEVETPS